MKTHSKGMIGIACLLLTACNPKEEKKEIDYFPPVSYDPPSYVCYKAPTTITIDGVLSAEEWDMVPWTADFVDIEGDKQPKPYLQTRAKMAYDDAGLYIAALLEEPHIWADITEHDAVIFQNNNFEFFIDPTNDTHNYVEYEVNALGTEWDLFLSKPYRDEGCLVFSNWEFMGMQSAVHIDGTINKPNDTDKSWSIEIFLPWKSVYQLVPGKRKPEPGDQIRMNFSRVEWETKVEDGKYIKVPFKGEEKIREHNWVWAPTGVIDIHRPELWGFVQFSEKPAGTGEETFVASGDEDTKWMLRNLYHRQRQYLRKFGQYATSIADLKPEEVCPEEIVPQLTLDNTPSMYEMSLPSPNGRIWRIRQDGLVWSR
ncbi:hypothetical protein M2459_001849 [Parabacteroides sp. PF5-5]|uniref:carbohydrate-binding family 9-like protein n=1 Tax=unclassified Parabacteroides TaxID=2649774 RepID=UPI002473E6EE|nr:MULTISPECIES: carbohydrate-binding family 9-like protein [unclassified Parabacteroides]MDH6305396.1 hypothetical protein [Parabacteroides sp. PH5-39]MDH6316106.1 hypothetical protein [Parabacteroides sp. PF5-13]MDH6320256.1 hypothetical protein [Parabacteroides sp. PH5-13]MDH6323986.1 hypothetical protein [Parabacteroides sp. PH5-8]MDH6327297.1 hypothetical protein [Parabacteroides sp. PH5-41]